MKLDGLGNPLDPNELYCVQCTPHYAGDFVLWWGKNSSGYTYKLEQAGQYTGARCEGMREIDVPWPVELVERHTCTAVDITKLR